MGNSIVYAILYSLIQYIKYLSVYMGISHSKIKSTKSSYMYPIIIGIIINAFCYYKLGNQYFNSIVIFTGILLFVSIFKDNKFKVVVLYFVVSTAFYIIDSFIYMLIYTYVDIKVQEMMAGTTFNLLNVIVTLPAALIILAVGSIKKDENYESEDFKKVLPQYLLMFVGVICCYITVMTTQKIMLYSISEKELKVACMAFTGICILLYLISIWQLRITASRNYYLKKDIYQQEYIVMQDRYFEEILNKEEQLRSFRHDLRAHMIAIQDMSNQKDYDNLNKYTQTILETMDHLKRYNFSGNGVVDAVVSDILKSVEEQKITVHWYGQLPPELAIDRFDLCTVFSNLIKNAVEACLKIPIEYGRFIKINTDIFEGILTISISNPYYEPVVIVDGKPQTTKKNSTFHGYGLRNIERTVEKYSGMVSYDVGNGMFTVEVVMHQYIDM